MAFVSTQFKVGDTIRLDERVDLTGGYFEPGTVMKIVSESHRGYDLEDDNGNKLYEYGLLRGFAKMTKI
jgi:hypothetical protein